MEDRVTEKMTESINKIMDEGLNTSNVELLYKLVDIYKDVKEVKNMNYGEYGNYGARRAGYDAYGRGNYGAGSYIEYGRGSYGRQGRDMKYRGEDELDRMYGEYGRYQESRNRYGNGEETDRSFHYMVKSLEDFIKVLYEEAETPQQKQQLMQALQNSMQ